MISLERVAAGVEERGTVLVLASYGKVPTVVGIIGLECTCVPTCRGSGARNDIAVDLSNRREDRKREDGRQHVEWRGCWEGVR